MSDQASAVPDDDVPPGFEPLDWHKGFGCHIGPIFERTGGETGYVRAFRVGPQHTNGVGNCHGGMLMAFADTAFGHCVSVRYPNRFWVTVRLLTDFLSSAKLGEWVEGTGEVLSEADDFFTIKGRIWCAERTLMTGTGVFKAMGERTRPRG